MAPSPEYSKKTNAELAEILKSRGLPSTGKKADLVAQLLKSDKESAEASSTTNTPNNNYAENADDVIDWEDDPLPEQSSSKPEADAPIETSDKDAAPVQEAPAATTPAPPSAAPPVEPPKPANREPQASAQPTTADATTPKPAENAAPTLAGAPAEVPAEAADDKPSANEDGKPETSDKPGAAPAESQPETNFSIGLSATDLEAELAKRKARAEKFGTLDETTATQFADQQKAIDRAKRFGEAPNLDADGVPAVKGLDQALPEKSRKRRGTHNDHDDGRKRRNGFRGRSRGQSGRGNRNQRNGRSGNGGGGGGGGWSEQDRNAIEKRKARFG